MEPFDPDLDTGAGVRDALDLGVGHHRDLDQPGAVDVLPDLDDAGLPAVAAVDGIDTGHGAGLGVDFDRCQHGVLLVALNSYCKEPGRRLGNKKPAAGGPAAGWSWGYAKFT